MKTTLQHLLFVGLFSLCCFASFGQQNQSTFESSGFRLITEFELSQSQIDILRNFDFEAYRRLNEPVGIQIVEGPMIHLYSTSRVETGQEEYRSFLIESTEIHVESAHEHEEAPVAMKVDIIVLDVFNVVNNSEAH